MAVAIVLISTEPGKDRKVANEVKRLKGVERVWLVSGLYDVVAIVRSKGAEDTLALVYDKVRPISGVKSSQTMFSLEV